MTARGGVSRRRFLTATGALAGLVLWPAWRGVAGDAEGPDASGAQAAGPLDPALREALDRSGFVYVSPLLAGGRESTCHGEVWFGWLDGAVVLITGSGSWKARALERGLRRARIWVGDHGRWKRLLGRNEAFRQAPSFDARAERVRDEALLDRLLSLYEQKYPREIGDWRDRMRAGYRDGSRVLIRYVPV